MKFRNTIILGLIIISVLSQSVSATQCDLIGPQGERGPNGDAGPDGLQGYQGYQGDRGYQGDQGYKGPKGERGVDISKLCCNCGIGFSLYPICPNNCSCGGPYECKCNDCICCTCEGYNCPKACQYQDKQKCFPKHPYNPYTQ